MVRRERDQPLNVRHEVGPLFRRGVDGRVRGERLHHPHRRVAQRAQRFGLHVALRQRLLVQLDYLLHRCFVLGRNDSQGLVLLDRVLGALGGVPDDNDDDDNK